MSCWTFYLLRDEDGSTWHATDKHGLWLIDSIAGRDGVRELIRERALPLAEGGPVGVDDGCCRGVAIDWPGRRFRCFPCYGDDKPTLFEIDRTVRAAPVWSGWDAGLAIGGREELAALIPEAQRAVRPYSFLDEPVDRPNLEDHREEWFVGWDPAAFELTVRHAPESANWYINHIDLVTVITPELAVLEHRVFTRSGTEVHPLLAWLRLGPAALAPLGPPFPPADDEEFVDSGVVIDQDRRIIHYWLTGFVPDRLLRTVQAAWPGWQVRPIHYGLTEHLALTGQAGEALPPDVLIDPRPLRRPVVRVVE